jgi:hypothetical protein
LTSILTVLTLFKVQFDDRAKEKPGLVPLVCAALFTAVSGWMLYSKINEGVKVLLWPGVVVAVATVSYLGTTLLRGKAKEPS